MFYKFKSFEGPKQFVFKDPDTGREFKEANKKLLIDRIQVYRTQNNLEVIEFIDTVLESYWCSLPENAGKCVSVQFKRGLLGYWRGGIAILTNIAYNSFATFKEAQARADICVTCPHNIFPDKGPFLAWADERAKHMVGDRKTTVDSKLGNCELCTCPLRAKVHIGGTSFGIDQEVNKLLPDFCWQKKHG